LIRFNLNGCILHINRLIGLISGYFNYRREKQQTPGNETIIQS